MKSDLDIDEYIQEVDAAKHVDRLESLTIAKDTHVSTAKRAAHFVRAISGSGSTLQIDDDTFLEFLRDSNLVVQRLAISCSQTFMGSKVSDELWRIWETKCENSLSALLQLVLCGDDNALKTCTLDFNVLSEDEKAQTVAAIGLTRNTWALEFLEKQFIQSSDGLKHSIALALARCGVKNSKNILEGFIHDCSTEEKVALVCELAAGGSSLGLQELKQLISTEFIPEVALWRALFIAGIVDRSTVNWRSYVNQWIVSELSKP